MEIFNFFFVFKMLEVNLKLSKIFLTHWLKNLFLYICVCMMIERQN